MGFFEKRGSGSLAQKLQQKFLGPFGFSLRRASLNAERIEKLRMPQSAKNDPLPIHDEHSYGNVKTFHVRGVKDD